MCCHVRSASVSRRRRRQPRFASAPSRQPLAVLDLEKPGEREAHDFLCRAGSKDEDDRLWTLLDARRHERSLLCVVRLAHPDDAARPFALAEVSLVEKAVYWRCYPTEEVARAEMDQRCAAPSPQGT